MAVDFTEVRRLLDIGNQSLIMAENSAREGRPNSDRERQAAICFQGAVDLLLKKPPVPTSPR